MGRSKVVIDINGNVENFQRSLNQIKKETKSLESALKTVATRGGIAFGALGAGIGAAVAQAAKFESINTQFEVLIGNAEGAQKALDELKDFSASTPFEFESIAKAGQQLLGFGFAADELRPKLEEIGNVAAAVGKPIDEIGLIFGQVSAAGKLTGERLLQFQERAIPIGPAIAKTLGVAESSVKDLVSKGLVDFATFEKAFSSLSQKGGIAFGALDKQSQTVSGQFSTLKDNVSLLVADFGTEFLPVVKSVVSSLVDFIQVLRQNKELVKFSAIAVGVATAVAGVATAVAGAGLVILKLKVAFAAAGAAVGLLTAPLTLIVAAVGAVGFAIFTFQNEIQAAFGAAFDVVQSFAERAGNSLKAFGKILAGIATFNVETIKEGFSELTNLESQGLNAADTFAKGYEERMAEFRQAELERQIELNELKIEQNGEFRQQKLEQDAEFNQMEIDAETAKLREQFNLKLQNSAAAQALEKKAQKETEKREKEAQKQKEKDAKKRRSQELENESTLQSSLATLSRSSNRELFEIGKAGSIAQAVVNTAEGATKALAQGGIIGPVLAALVTAAGAVQIATIQSQTFQAASGFSGSGSKFGESFVSTFTPREIVVPERFSEGIKKGEFSLSAPGGEGQGGGSEMRVVIGFTDDAFEIIEERLIERERLGTSLRG